MTSLRLSNKDVCKLGLLLKNNPLLHCGIGEVLEARKLCENNNETRFLRKCLTFCRGLHNESFGEYFSRLLQYIRTKKPSTTDGLYNAEFVSVKLNITLEQAKEEVDKAKASKSTSLSSFIERHGPENGRALFYKFVKTSNWRVKYIDTHGQAAMDIKNKQSTLRSYHAWVAKGHTEEDARAMASRFQKENSGAHRDYYSLRGYTTQETDEILTEIAKRKDSHGHTRIVYIETYGYPLCEVVYAAYCKYSNDSRSVSYFKRRFGQDWESKYNAASKNWVGSRAVSADTELTWRYYKIDCLRQTARSIRHHGDRIKDLHLRGNDYHVDHVFSIYDGFMNNIDSAVVSHYSNLRVISARSNMSKGVKSDKTVSQLIHDYNFFESQP